MRSNMVVYLFFIFICTRLVFRSAGSNNPTLQQEVHGVEAMPGLNSNINEPDESKYTLKEGGRGGAHGGGGGGDADVDRSRHVPRNIVQSKRIVSFSITFGSFILLLFAL
ncbi:hypothetical protein Hanom_Chr09g00830581 [Helianthus anomalus]